MKSSIKHRFLFRTRQGDSSGKLSRVSIAPGQSKALPYFLFALTSISIAAVSFENGLHPALLAVLPLIFIALSRRDYSQPFGLSERGWAVLFLLYIAVLPATLLAVQDRISLPQFFVYFTFGLLLVRIFSPLTDRNVSQMIFLTLGLIIVNCILTNDMLFAVVLLVYFFVLSGTLLLFHIARNRTDFGEISGLPATGPLRTRWYGRLAAYTLLVIPSTVILFVFVPRPFIVLPGWSGPMVHGGGMAALEQRISYRDMVDMANRQRIAFMVSIQKGKLPFYPYWRGRVLEKYDRRSWYSDERAKAMTKIVRYDPSELVKYQVIPYRLQSRTVYVSGMPLMVTGGMRRPLEITDRGEVVIDTSIAVSDSYKVLAVERPVPISGKDSETNLDGTGITPNIERLAVLWSSKAVSPRQKAEALTSRLKKDFRYRLDTPPPPPGANPAEYFLFQARAGHCEYFAGTLCLMLRAIGIPARVVEGFAGAEETDVKGEFIVRFANAHAWVEAILDSSGWTRLDPTPPASTGTAYSQLWRMLGDAYDHLDYLWVKRVIYFDRSDQMAMYRGVGDLLAGKASLLSAVSWRVIRYPAIGLCTIVLVAAIAQFAYRFRRRRQDISEIYRSIMERIVKMGVLDQVHPWHEKNVREILRRAPKGRKPLGRFMDAYLQGRFGSRRDVSPEDLRKAGTDLLESLRVERRREDRDEPQIT